MVLLFDARAAFSHLNNLGMCRFSSGLCDWRRIAQSILLVAEHGLDRPWSCYLLISVVVFNTLFRNLPIFPWHFSWLEIGASLLSFLFSLVFGFLYLDELYGK